MKNDVALSLILPVFNEQDSISPFLERATPVIDEALALIGPDATAEFLFVDDGSLDRTGDILKILAGLNPRIKLLSLSRNFGKEAALAAGINHARGAAVIPIDVDLQDPPELIIPMVRAWLDGAKVVNARRADRNSDTLAKRWSAALFYKIINKLSDHPIPKNVGDFRLLDREAVEVLRSLREQGRFNKGLFSWIGFPVVFIDYEREARFAGMSKWRVSKLWNLALDAVTSSTITPLRIWTYVGGTIAMGAFVYAMVLIVLALSGRVDTPGYASLMVVTLMLGGLNLLSMGIIGEYLGRVAIEVRARPLYIVQSPDKGHEQIFPPSGENGQWTDQHMRA
jgi:glycosyltransferase involved in cell wall biosynthesis